MHDVHRQQHARRVGDQPGGHGVARLLDADGAEVDGDHVERRLARAVHHAGHLHEDRVDAVRLDHVAEDRQRPAAAQRAGDRHRQDLRRDAHRAEDRPQAVHQVLHRAGRAEHPDREQDRDEVRDDPHRDVEAFLRAGDELLVHRRRA